MGGGDGVGGAALVFLALQRGDNLRSVPRILNGEQNAGQGSVPLD